MKNKISFFLLFSLALVCHGQGGFGLAWKSEKDTVLLGEPFDLTLEIPAQKLQREIIWPSFTDSLGRFEILQVNWLDSGEYRAGFKLNIVGYDSGSVSIPAIELGFLDQGDTIWLEIPSKSIEILSPLVNLEADFQDILANPDPGYHWHEFIPIFSIILLVLVLGIALFWYLRRKRRKIPSAPVLPAINPFDAAIHALDSLSHQAGNLSDEEIKAFYTDAVDVLRTLVDEVYCLDVSEMSSSEWLSVWKRRPENELTGKELAFVLYVADLVKFAKQQPGPAERSQLIEAAKVFIEACRKHQQPNLN
ncbi:MAG: hypothetical protein O3C32_00450 [Bacteroidetes bacterium]|nr:hypothetical protein [Bacteroidota bacterium]